MNNRDLIIQEALDYLESYGNSQKYTRYYEIIMNYINELEKYKQDNETSQQDINEVDQVSEENVNNEDESDTWEFTFINVPGKE